MATIKTYTVDRAKRRILTVKNMEELGITDELLLDLLKKTPLFEKNQVDEKGANVKDSNNNEIKLWPVGLSINDKKVGNFPDPNAAQRGWMAFFEIGAPLFEERSNIIQPTADVISTRSFENRTSLTNVQFSDTIEFAIENTINWTLAATGTTTFEGEIEGELQGEISKTLETILEESLANGLEKENSKKCTKTQILHDHKDEIGTETQVAVEEEEEVTKTTEFTATNSNSQSFTGTGTAIGRGQLEAELELSLTGTISGTLTTSWNSTSNVSGVIPNNSRVETLATQRRQVKQFTYEIPITFDGLFALNYDELVSNSNFLKEDSGSEPIPFSKSAAKIIPAHISMLKLEDYDGTNKLYRPKGMAETVSALDVNHTIFEPKVIDPPSNGSKDKFELVRPHNL